MFVPGPPVFGRAAPGVLPTTIERLLSSNRSKLSGLLISVISISFEELTSSDLRFFEDMPIGMEVLETGLQKVHQHTHLQ